MATTKKTMAKESALKAQPEEYRMPVEVKEWIDQASSRINAMRTEIDRLKEENKSLKRSHKLMEQRVMGTSSE